MKLQLHVSFHMGNKFASRTHNVRHDGFFCRWNVLQNIKKQKQINHKSDWSKIGHTHVECMSPYSVIRAKRTIPRWRRNRYLRQWNLWPGNVNAYSLYSAGSMLIILGYSLGLGFPRLAMEVGHRIAACSFNYYYVFSLLGSNNSKSRRPKML